MTSNWVDEVIKQCTAKHFLFEYFLVDSTEPQNNTMFLGKTLADWQHKKNTYSKHSKSTETWNKRIINDNHHQTFQIPTWSQVYVVIDTALPKYAFAKHRSAKFPKNEKSQNKRWKLWHGKKSGGWVATQNTIPNDAKEHSTDEPNWRFIRMTHKPCPTPTALWAHVRNVGTHLPGKPSGLANNIPHMGHVNQTVQAWNNLICVVLFHVLRLGMEW